MRRAYSPKEIAQRTYKCLEWDGEWAESFGYPEENSTWLISGASAAGKSSFVMQLARKLTEYGRVLYLSYEEGVSRSFQERVLRFNMDAKQGSFRVVTDDTVDDLKERLRKRHSAKFVIVDSIQHSGWIWPEVKDIVGTFPKKSFIFISQEHKGQVDGHTAEHILYMAGVKVKVTGYKAYCKGRFIPTAGACFTVWPDGVIQTTNNL